MHVDDYDSDGDLRTLTNCSLSRITIQKSMTRRHSQSSMMMSKTGRFSSLSIQGSKFAYVNEWRAIRVVVALVGVEHSASLTRTSTHSTMAMVTGRPRSIPTHV